MHPHSLHTFAATGASKGSVGALWEKVMVDEGVTVVSGARACVCVVVLSVRNFV